MKLFLKRRRSGSTVALTNLGLGMYETTNGSSLSNPPPNSRYLYEPGFLDHKPWNKVRTTLWILVIGTVALYLAHFLFSL